MSATASLRRRVLATGATVVGLSAATAATADAVTNGRIVFQGLVGERAQVFTVAPDGSDVRQVTNVGGDGAGNPVWSPDASRIAFDNGTEDTGVDVFTVRPDGTALFPLPLGLTKYHGDPAYSPDGARISYDGDSGPGEPSVHGIFIARADGTQAQQLTTALSGEDAYDTESQWSPDGTRIAFTRVKDTKRAAIFTINVDGTGLRRLTPYKLDAASPDWSPDGRKIAFNSYWDPHPGRSANVFVMKADGTGRRNITRHRGGRRHSFRPSWAPDGTKLAIARFVPKGRRGRLDLYTIDPDGSSAKRITRGPRLQFAAQPDWGTAP